MPLFLTCLCGQPLQALDADAGKRVRCPRCGAVIQVPAPPAAVPLGPPAALPPHAAVAEVPAWFVTAGGRREGPLTLAQFRDRAAGGGLRPTDLVWKEGMRAWLPACEVHEVAALFPPPPLPAPAEVMASGAR